MKLTSLTIQPVRSYSSLSEDNPLRAVVKLNAEHSAVECVLSDETMRKLLDICADEIAQNAKANINEFVAAVTQLDHGKSAVLLGEATQ